MSSRKPQKERSSHSLDKMAKELKEHGIEPEDVIAHAESIVRVLP